MRVRHDALNLKYFNQLTDMSVTGATRKAGKPTMRPSQLRPMSTIALLVSTASDSITLVEALSDEHEIAIVARSLASGENDPLQTLSVYRSDKLLDEEKFADYVEELACKPALKTDIKEHCVNWLNSRARMEEFMRREREATRVIADYAYKILLEDPSQRDFVLASPKAQVRVQVFELPLPRAA